MAYHADCGTTKQHQHHKGKEHVRQMRQRQAVWEMKKQQEHQTAARHSKVSCDCQGDTPLLKGMLQ